MCQLFSQVLHSYGEAKGPNEFQLEVTVTRVHTNAQRGSGVVVWSAIG